MKKLLLTAMTAAMLLLPLGTVALADDEAAIPPAQVTQVNADYVPGEAPAESSAQSMVPALHAVLLAMENQGVTSFTTEDTDLSWEMLYNLLSMYGQMDDRSAYDGEELVLPSETVMDYSAVLFAAPLFPEQLPDSLSDRIVYDAATDEYRLYCGSDGLSEIKITASEDLIDSLSVSGKLMFLAEDIELASFTATLSTADNLFGYTLTELDVA